MAGRRPVADRLFAKTDERTLRVVDGGVTRDYNYEFLVKQRRRIKAQRARELDMRDAEMAEVEDLLAQCKRLGVQSLGQAHNNVPLQRLGTLEDEASDVPAAPVPPTLMARIWNSLTRKR